MQLAQTKLEFAYVSLCCPYTPGDFSINHLLQQRLSLYYLDAGIVGAETA
jgi:hypothetical protein